MVDEDVAVIVVTRAEEDIEMVADAATAVDNGTRS